MTVAVSKAIERGAKALICASTGNTSASAAAYAARAGIAHRDLPAGKSQAENWCKLAYGPESLRSMAILTTLRIVRELGDSRGLLS